MKTLELVELLDRLTRTRKHAQNVEPNLRVLPFVMRRHDATYSLTQRSALADRDAVSLLHTERRADVGSQVLVPLLVSRVFGDEVEVFAADDDRTMHLGRDDRSSENSAADGHPKRRLDIGIGAALREDPQSGERALLVCEPVNDARD